MHLAAQRSVPVEQSVFLFDRRAARVLDGNLKIAVFRCGLGAPIPGGNSFQFAADPVIALREARRVARPGGKVFIMTWGEPASMEVTALVAALKPLLPPMPPNASGPFALSEPGKLEELTAAAGLIPLEVFDVEAPWSYPNLATAQKGLGSSGVAAKATEISSQAALDAAHQAALAPFRQPDGSYRIGATFRILMAGVEVKFFSFAGGGLTV